MYQKARLILSTLMENNLLLSPDALPIILELDGEIMQLLQDKMELLENMDVSVLTPLVFEYLCEKKEVESKVLEEARAQYEKQDASSYERLIKADGMERDINERGKIPEQEEKVKDVSLKRKLEILVNYDDKAIKKNVQHFTSHYVARFKELSHLLKGRSELGGATAIGRIKQMSPGENVTCICMIKEKSITRNDNLIMEVEDLTGSYKILVHKNNQELYEEAKDICLDEVIGLTGNLGENIIFVNSLVWPEIPLHKELKKSPEEAVALFIGDLHIGAKVFLKLEFERFLSWLRGEAGTHKQQEIASKVKYLFIVGDLVEGVGIYPGQEEDLVIKDIYEQYNAFSQYIEKIPSHINIIICPGNHDALRIAEPQPPLYKDFVRELYEHSHVTMVSSPSIVRIGRMRGFPGFDVLLYHGYSFVYYADKVESIRMQGGLTRADLIAKYLLKRRHLGPSHSSALFSPDYNHDPLVIKTIPDFFITGHIHRTTVSHYRNVTFVNSSCWLAETAFQEKVGLKPQPAKVPYVDLKTRKVKILNFGGKEA